MKVDDIASLDLETGSHTDLRKVGAAKYAECPTTRLICGSYFVPGTGQLSWDYSTDPPNTLLNWISSGGKVSAWNATFEYYIWNYVVARGKDASFPRLKIENVIDTMAIAATNGLPLGLDDCAAALPHLGLRKDKKGHALMLRMSRPRNATADTWWHLDEPKRLVALSDYCDQDVRVERAILKDLVDMSPTERKIWLMDFEMGDRGMALDFDLVDKMANMAKSEVSRMNQQMSNLTGGVVRTANSNAALVSWCQRWVPKISSMQKSEVEKWLKELDPAQYPEVVEALTIRKQAAKSSVAKLTAMKNYACSDGRMRFLTQYYGAFRTGRWAGRGPQVQNYPRSMVKDQTGLVHAIKSGIDAEGLEAFFEPDVMTSLVSALRGCIKADDGYKFAAIDFSQIEARVLPWLAGYDEKLQVFIDGKDVYVNAASDMYHIKIEVVTEDQRQVGKVSELALGFGGGVGAFQTMAKNYGLIVDDEEAEDIKTRWRDANKKIVSFWYDLDSAAIKAVRDPGKIYYAGDHIRFRMNPDSGHLYMTLPSNRRLVYREALISEGKFGNDCVSYMGQDQYTRKWQRTDTYGGKWAENATQAVARDVMASAMLRTHRQLPKVRPLGSVHDELLIEINETSADEDFAEVNKVFHFVPVWAKGLPIAADGYVGDRFKKG